MKLTILHLVFIITATASYSQSGCLTFDGVDDYVKISNSAPANIGTGNFTVEAWIKGDEASQNPHPMIISNRSVSNEGFFVSFHDLWGGSQYKMLNIQLNGYNYLLINNGLYNGNVLDNTNHHIAITRNSDSLYFYVDGSLIGTRGIIGNPDISSTSNSLWIGQDIFTNNCFEGSIGEVRIWNVARSQSEISANMNIDVSGAPALEGYWRLAEGSGQMTTDETGNSDGILGNLVTVDQNDPTWIANCQMSSIGLLEDHYSAVTLFPNPTSGIINVESEIPMSSLKIIDPTGKLVLEKSIEGNKQITLNIDHLEQGIYFVHVSGSNHSFIKQITIY